VRTARRRGVLTVLRFAPCFPSSPTRVRAQEDVRHSRAHPGTCPLRVRAQPGSWLRVAWGVGMLAARRCVAASCARACEPGAQML